MGGKDSMIRRPPHSFQSIAETWNECKAILGGLQDDSLFAVYTSLEVENGGGREKAIYRAS